MPQQHPHAWTPRLVGPDERRPARTTRAHRAILRAAAYGRGTAAGIALRAALALGAADASPALRTLTATSETTA